MLQRIDPRQKRQASFSKEQLKGSFQERSFLKKGEPAFVHPIRYILFLELHMTPAMISTEYQARFSHANHLNKTMSQNYYYLHVTDEETDVVKD